MWKETSFRKNFYSNIKHLITQQSNIVLFIINLYEIKVTLTFITLQLHKFLWSLFTKQLYFKMYNKTHFTPMFENHILYLLKSKSNISLSEPPFSWKKFMILKHDINLLYIGKFLHLNLPVCWLSQIIFILINCYLH